MVPLGSKHTLKVEMGTWNSRACYGGVLVFIDRDGNAIAVALDKSWNSLREADQGSESERTHC
jgi:hypothetical protein